MNTQSRVLFNHAGYTACAIKIGLTVQKGDRGIHLPFPQAKQWIESIEQAVDKDEALALCKAALRR